MRHAHIENTQVTAKFSRDRKYRYRLEITLKNTPPGKTACVLMQNPSYANEEVADKSVQFMEKVVFQKNLPEFRGVTRLIVVNQFARIQTHNFRGLPEEIGRPNNRAIQIAFHEAEMIILAWGCANPFEARKAFALGLLGKLHGKKVFITKKHPSRGCYEGFIRPFHSQPPVTSGRLLEGRARPGEKSATAFLSMNSRARSSRHAGV